jgi:menaquinone-dependent protoporphyrinogen oxidase
MRVLVGYASKHGSTREIAERVASRLQQPGRDVDLRSIVESFDAAGFDAFVLGSSIYMGHWNKDAVAFVHRKNSEILGLPTLLFSSGHIGDQ